MPTVLQVGANSLYRQLLGVGGVGTGIFFELAGDHTLGRNESRLGRLLDVRDYCKLHIVIHYIAKLLGAQGDRGPFRIIPFARVGADAVGERVVREMSDAGIDTSRIHTASDRPTLFSVCFQYPNGAGGNITTNNSAAALISETDLDAAADLLRAAGPRTIALAVPEVPLAVRHHFLKLAADAGAFCAASFVAGEVKPAIESGMFELIDLVSLNENEGEELVGSPFLAESAEAFVEKCQCVLRASFPRMKLIISAGKCGAYGITATESGFCPAIEVDVKSTAGAGDSLLGGVLASIAAGVPFLSKARDRNGATCAIDSALQLGVLLGSYKCLSPHTIHPHASLDTLIEFAHAHGLSFSTDFRQQIMWQA